MHWLRFDRLFGFFAGTEFFLCLLWAGLAGLSIAILILMRTRWGQSRPLRKCLVLSLLAHLLLIGYATTVQIVSTLPSSPGEPVISVSLETEPSRSEPTPATSRRREEPWEQLVHEPPVQPEPNEPAPAPPQKPPKPERTTQGAQFASPADTNLDHLPLTEAVKSMPETLPAETPNPKTTSDKSAEPIRAPAAQRRDAVPTVIPLEQPPKRHTKTVQSDPTTARQGKTGVPSVLLERPVPLPRIPNTPTMPRSADSLAGQTDTLTQTTHGKPADAGVAHPQNAANGGARASGLAAGAERLARPSLPSLDGKRLPGHDRIGRPGGKMTNVGPPRLPRPYHTGPGREMPEIYRLRVAPDRSRIALAHGATNQTEAAVEAALRWLADNQAADGRWDPRKHQAGRETMVAGRDRRSAGIRADTAMTGLALLAFLAAGHTHQQGEYEENVRCGLEYLLRVQKADGSLAGPATAFAAMYCHAIATFALSEASAMTGDERLREPIRRAVAYSLSAQDPTLGGWRYVPRDPGDTSQLGWQLMALKSAELGGIPMPGKTRRAAIRFLSSVSSGEHGGLAAYRVGQPPSRPMTAEALVCRRFLGLPIHNSTGNEAGDYILGELPGEGRTNLYYWYYATLGMYQLQGAHWQRWNEALQATLVQSQRKTGPEAGSWDPNTVWGSYGGRIYSTALATLSLEVYYRYLPLYIEAASVEKLLR